MYRYIFFDLDGTLTDSKEGIVNCVRYAIEQLGDPVPPEETLLRFIGPPLQESFSVFCGYGPEKIEKAAGFYRERYKPIGQFENRAAPGAAEMLSRLKDQGRCLALASSKTESACVGILEYFGIKSLFDLIGGATEDGRISQKAEVLQMVMERLALPDAADYLLIGDTRFDALGAKAVGMDCLGVTYGFGTHTELDQAGVVGICGSLPEAEQFLERWDSSVLAEKAGTKERLTQAD